MSDFSDSFCNYITQYTKNTNDILFFHRLSKYAILNTFGTKKPYCQRPDIAIKILLNEIRVKFSHDDIISLLVYYIIKYSYLLSPNDINNFFDDSTIEKIKLLQEFESIANSNTIITNAKKLRIAEKFESIIFIKTAIIIANLRSLKLVSEKLYPKKVQRRYLPMYEYFPTSYTRIQKELKKNLLKHIKYIQNHNDYNITTSDLFTYMSIIK